MSKKRNYNLIYPSQILSQFSTTGFSSFVSRDPTLARSYTLETPLIQDDQQFFQDLKFNMSSSKYPYRSYSSATDSKYAIIFQKTNLEDFIKIVKKERPLMIKPDSHFINHIVASVELIDGFFDAFKTSKQVKETLKNYYVKDNRYGNYGCFYIDLGQENDMSMQNLKYDIFTIGVKNKNYIITVIKLINRENCHYLSAHLPQTPFIRMNLYRLLNTSSTLSWVGKHQKKQYDIMIKSNVIDFNDKGWFEDFKKTRLLPCNQNDEERVEPTAPSEVSSNISWSRAFGSMAEIFSGSRNEQAGSSDIQEYFS